ncbi:hypothetical protein BH09BAC1_BH09BAC1_08020 [soil metagenome]
MSDKVTDLTFLGSFTGNDPQKIKRYVQMFLDRAPDQLEEIRTSLGMGDYENLRVAAHSIKPQLAYMGIKSLEQDIRAIEEISATQTNLEALPNLVQKLETILKQGFIELQEYVNAN